MEGIADALFPFLDKEARISLLNECTAFENEYLIKHCPKPYPFVRETLLALKQKGFLLSILSNAQQGYIEAFFLGTGLASCFIDHCCWGDNHLPKSKNMLLIKNRNKLDDIYYIGDTSMDEKEADLIGVKFIFASYGFGKAQHPFFTLKQFSDLLKVPTLF